MSRGLRRNAGGDDARAIEEAIDDGRVEIIDDGEPEDDRLSEADEVFIEYLLDDATVVQNEPLQKMINQVLRHGMQWSWIHALLLARRSRIEQAVRDGKLGVVEGHKLALQVEEFLRRVKSAEPVPKGRGTPRRMIIEFENTPEPDPNDTGDALEIA